MSRTSQEVELINAVKQNAKTTTIKSLLGGMLCLKLPAKMKGVMPHKKLTSIFLMKKMSLIRMKLIDFLFKIGIKLTE
jgi:hypothetical protein